MKNLKKTLCLVLAFTMLLGVMVISTGAANFTDNSKIVNTEAVDTMSALNIINGLPDGSFNPSGIVTRAEMCKMICVALNGGKDPQLGTTSYSYTDTVGNWAAGYIEYCTNLGIVSGRGNGIFDPTGTVTATEAAKMLLVAIGYDAAAEGFTGASWAIAVNVRANQKDLYEDLAIDVSAGLTRDNAAQMVYNAINATMVKYEYQIVAGTDGTLSTKAVAEDVTTGATTILEKKFDMQTVYGYMDGITYDEDEDTYTYSINSTITTFGSPAITSDASGDTSFDSSADYSALFGMKVKVLYKDNTDQTVYGMYAEDSSVILSSVAGKLPGCTSTATSVKVSGTTYKLSDTTTNVPVFAFNGASSVSLYAFDGDGTCNTYAFKLIDNDGDGKGDVVVYVPYTVGKVTFVGSDTLTVANTSYDKDDCILYTGLAKNDYVKITADANTATGKTVMEKVSAVSGTADAIGQVSSTDSTPKITLGGTTYTNAASFTGDSYSLGSTYELIAVNGYVFNSTKVNTAATSSNVCLVVAPSTSANSYNANAWDAKLLMADGTYKFVTVDKITTGATVDETITSGDLVAGTIYTYSVDSDGNYELKAIVAGDYDSAAENTATGLISDGKTASGYRFADDAIVFYYTGSAYKVTTGATANAWADITSASATDDLYANTTSGFNYVVLAYIAFGSAPEADGDTSYGWVTASPTLVKDGDDYYVSMTIWTGTGTTAETFNAESVYGLDGDAAVLVDVDSGTTTSDTLRATSAANKGQLVSFKDPGDGTISEVKAAGAVNAITGYADGGDEVQFNATPASGATALSTIEDDSVILYVDCANNAGVTGGAISIANKNVLGAYINNCYVLANVDDEIKVLVVDTTNKVGSDACAITALTAGAAATISETNKTISLTGLTLTNTINGSVFGAGVTASTMSTGSTYAVIKGTGNTNATQFEVGDILRVVAANGTYADYSFIA